MKWSTICAASLVFVVSAHAASQGEQLVQSLLECSPKYFAQIQGAADLTSAGYIFTPKGRLIVPNARDELGLDYLVMGTKPMEIGGMTVVGMYDLHRKANTFETLGWGLLVKGDPESLARRLNRLLPQDRSLQSDGIFGFVRLDKTTLKAWPKWGMQKPLPPPRSVEFGDLEMVAEITIADEELLGVSRVGCSLQGVFPPFVLQQLRPDID